MKIDKMEVRADMEALMPVTCKVKAVSLFLGLHFVGYLGLSAAQYGLSFSHKNAEH